MWRAQVGDGFHPLVPEASQPSFLQFNDIINHTPLFVKIKSQLNLYLLGAKQSVHNAIYNNQLENKIDKGKQTL